MAAPVGGAAAALTLCKRYNGRDSGRKETAKGLRSSDGVTPPHARLGIIEQDLKMGF